MSDLGKRIGDKRAADLMGKFRAEQAQERYGVRDPGQPSEALTEIQRNLLHSEFTMQERAQIRTALGIDPLRDVNGLPGGPTFDELWASTTGSEQL